MCTDEANCIVFDRIFAWEAAPYAATDWWRDVPLHVRAKLTFFNLPCESVRGSLGSSQPSSQPSLAGAGAGASTGGAPSSRGSRPSSDAADPSSQPSSQPSSRPPSAADPLALIRAVARVDDFVVLKVDIDGGPELELVERVADNEGGIASLIDEVPSAQRIGAAQARP